MKGIEIDNKNLISNLHYLKRLTLRNYNEADDIISLSKNFPKLEAIDFGCVWNRNKDKEIALAFDELFSKRSSTLKEISLKFTYEDSFLRKLSLCQNIVTFKANGCKLTKDSLTNISELPALETIVFHEINTNNDSKALITFLKNVNKKNLKYLVFSECRGCCCCCCYCCHCRLQEPRSR